MIDVIGLRIDSKDREETFRVTLSRGDLVRGWPISPDLLPIDVREALREWVDPFPPPPAAADPPDETRLIEKLSVTYFDAIGDGFGGHMTWAQLDRLDRDGIRHAMKAFLEQLRKEGWAPR